MSYQKKLKLTSQEFFYDHSFDDYIRIGGHYYKNKDFDKVETLFEYLSIINSSLSQNPDLSCESFIMYNCTELLSLVPNLTSLYEFSNCSINLTHNPIVVINSIDTVNCKIDSKHVQLDIFEICVTDLSELKSNLFTFSGIFHLHSVSFHEELVMGETVLKMRIRGYEQLI